MPTETPTPLDEDQPLPGMPEPAPVHAEIVIDDSPLPDHAATLRAGLESVATEIAQLRMVKARIAPRLRVLLAEEARLHRALRPYETKPPESAQT